MKNYFLLSLFLFMNCNKQQDDNLTIPKTAYNGTQLKINGYFNVTWSSIGNGSLVFLYQNGTLLIVDYNNPNSISPYLQSLKNTAKNTLVYTNNKTFWGRFIINSNSIEYENWSAPTNTQFTKCYLYSGVILNDTTFVISKSMRVDNTEQRSYNDTFHFKTFSFKPDSTNSFTN